MRKLILLLLLAAPSYASLSSTVQWDVRTTGSDSNSGGFDPAVSVPGTDYSQQNSPQITYTDLVVGATTTTYTSVLNVVSSALPGNTLVVTGGTGCTTGTYEVLSNATITATVDRSLGTAASVCTAVLGGSKLTNSAAFALAVAGNTVNTKAGTYTVTATLGIPFVSGFAWIGYGTTHGDGGTKPLITTATNSTDLVDDSAYHAVINNISFSNTAGTPGIGLLKTSGNSDGQVLNCKFTGFTYGINGDNSGPHYIFQSLYLFNTEIASSTTAGISNNSSGDVVNSYIHGNTTYGIQAIGGNWVVQGSVLDSNGYGFYDNNGGNVLMLDSVASNSTHDGVYNAASPQSSYGSVNSIYWNNGGYGINNESSGGPPTMYANNAFGSNTSGTINNPNLVTSATANDQTLTANPFTSGTVFTLNSTSGGGALLKGAGYPGATAAGTGYIDVGALQSKGSSGGTAFVFVQ